MKNTGALLKAKRESSGLSLSEVALSTKINPKILTAIENGEEGSLPAKTILKGFVRSYALFLKMDVEEVLRTFIAETSPPPPPVTSAGTTSERAQEAAKSETTTTSRRRVDEESSSGTRTIAVVVIVVLIGLIIGVRELIEKYDRERVVEQPTDMKITPVVPEAQVPVTEAKPADQAEATAPAPAEGAAEPATETAPPPPAVVQPIPIGVIAPAVPPTPEPAKAAEPPVTETKAASATTKTAKHEIILEALDKVEVKFQVRGETKRVSLGPTQVHTIHADQPISLDLSDGGAVNIILDGRERGVPGDLGKPKTIKIP